MTNKIQLQPYLYFNGNCGEVMEYYHSIFGGKLEVQKFSESPAPYPPEKKDWVMHSTLTFEGNSLMASDGMAESTTGSNVHLSLGGDDDKYLKSCFEKLAKGGEIMMKLEKQFWGDIFGMLTDKYGVHWMMNISEK